ncbi:MAG: hypothetical protein HN348_02780 [Proteobacteria bacterium]|jgi:hypothetical protein|nr:hypothetical protein [Pseudomonadota bacterium]
MRLALLFLLLPGCEILADLFSTDTTVDFTCAGEDTVVIDGRDICDDYEKFGKLDCNELVGYRLRIDGVLVCP